MQTNKKNKLTTTSLTVMNTAAPIEKMMVYTNNSANHPSIHPPPINHQSSCLRIYPLTIQAAHQPTHEYTKPATKPPTQAHNLRLQMEPTRLPTHPHVHPASQPQTYGCKWNQPAFLLTNHSPPHRPRLTVAGGRSAPGGSEPIEPAGDSAAILPAGQ